MPKVSTVSTVGGNGRRTRMGGEDRRAQIVVVAKKLFAERPYDSISMGDIATAVGTTRTNIHYHFTSKRDLFLEIVGQFSRIPTALYPSPIEDSLPVDSVVGDVLGRWLDAVERNSDVFLTMLLGSSSQDEEVRRVLGDSMRAWESRLTLLVGIDPTDPVHRAMVRSFQGMVKYATSEWLIQGDLDKASVHALLTHTLVALGDAAREVS